MGVLHLVNRSPGQSTALSCCLQRVRPGDAILLLEGGVYAAFKGSSVAPSLLESLADVTVHALAPDLALRGIAQQDILTGIVLVDYEGFVGLSISHSPIISWS